MRVWRIGGGWQQVSSLRMLSSRPWFKSWLLIVFIMLLNLLVPVSSSVKGDNNAQIGLENVMTFIWHSSWLIENRQQ